MKLARPRTRTVLISSVILLLAVTLVAWQNSRHNKLSLAEQQLVGTWRQVADDYSTAGFVILDYELRDDRSLHVSSTDRQTNLTSPTEHTGKWRLKNDMIVLSESPQGNGSIRQRIVNSLKSSLRSPDQTGFQIDTTDNVTMQLKLVRLDASGKIVPQPLATCTWLRVTPASAPPPPTP